MIEREGNNGSGSRWDDQPDGLRLVRRSDTQSAILNLRTDHQAESFKDIKPDTRLILPVSG